MIEQTNATKKQSNIEVIKKTVEQKENWGVELRKQARAKGEETQDEHRINQRRTLDKTKPIHRDRLRIP